MWLCVCVVPTLPGTPVLAERLDVPLPLHFIAHLCFCQTINDPSSSSAPHPLQGGCCPPLTARPLPSFTEETLVPGLPVSASPPTAPLTPMHVFLSPVLALISNVHLTVFLSISHPVHANPMASIFPLHSVLQGSQVQRVAHPSVELHEPKRSSFYASLFFVSLFLKYPSNTPLSSSHHHPSSDHP